MSSYEWDPEKARENLAKHGVSFDEAATVPDGDQPRWFVDVAHSKLDDRFYVFGYSDQKRLLFVVTSEGGPRPRIISAWRATKRERREYEAR